MSDCLFFGCWNVSGHYLFSPNGRWPGNEFAHCEYFGQRVHIDGKLAPRKITSNFWLRQFAVGQVCCEAMGKDAGESDRIRYDSEELQQGVFLRHVLNNGYTAIQWWDRCQGDTRGACNSTVLLLGVHASDVVVAAAREHFPHVLANLEKHCVQLIEVAP